MNKFGPEVCKRAMRMLQEQVREVSAAPDGGGLHCREDWLLGAHAYGMGEAGEC